MGPVARPVPGSKRPKAPSIFYGEKERKESKYDVQPSLPSIPTATSPSLTATLTSLPSSLSAQVQAPTNPSIFQRWFSTTHLPVDISSKLGVLPRQEESNHFHSPPSSTNQFDSKSLTDDTILSLLEPHYRTVSTSPVQLLQQEPVGHRTEQLKLSVNGTAQVVLNLTKDVLEAFSDVPYVKIIVGFAQTIIKINDDIKASREECDQLVENAINFLQIVFEAILASKDSRPQEFESSSIKKDLLQIGSVFESVLEVLEYLKNWGMASRLRSFIYRNEISQKIKEQNRRLDTANAMFQLKSTISIRKDIESLGRHEYKPTPPSADLAFGSGSSREIITPQSEPQIFYGRDSETADVSSHLEDCLHKNVPARLCILGIGGIGKTSLARYILHHEVVCTKKFDQENAYIISCEASQSAELLLGELAASFAISTQGNILKRVKTLLTHLRENPCLLVLDNFETPWAFLGGRSQVEVLLTEISSIETVTLILTMRGSQPPSGPKWSKVIHLKTVNVESALDIFQAISLKATDKYARLLVEAVDCIPLAVTLLAKLAAVDEETSEDLWIRWEKENIAMVGQGGGRLDSLDKSIELSISSPRMKHVEDSGAIILLSALSLLPDGMSPETLRVCGTNFPGGLLVQRAVSTLRQNALVYEDVKKNLRVLNPIRLFVRKQHPASKSSREFLYNYFIQLALHGSSYTDTKIRTRLETEAGNINAILMDALELPTDSLELAELVRVIISFNNYAYVSGKGSSQLLSRAIEKLEASNSAITKTSAFLTHMGGRTRNVSWRGLRGRLQILMPYSNKERSQLDVVNEGGSTALKIRADCLGCLGQLLCQQSKFALAQEKFELAQGLHKRAGDTGGYAYDTLNLGLILSQNENNSEEAMELFHKAILLHEEIGDKLGKAYGLLAVGGTLREIYRFLESEKRFSEAHSLFLDIGDTSGQATALNGLGTVLLCCSRFVQAEQQFKAAAKLSADAGDIIGQAESVSGIAVILLLCSRLPEAQTKIEDAISLRAPYEDPDYLHVLGRIFIGKEDWNQAENALSRALAIHQQIGDVRGEADDLCYLASIQYSRGDPQGVRSFGCLALIKSASKATTAQVRALWALMLIRGSLFPAAERAISWSLKAYEDMEDIMGQAHIFYVSGIYHFRLGDLDEAMKKLKRALELHGQVGHLKGQADVLNIMGQIHVLQNSIPQAKDAVERALSIHITIGNKSGQGNDFYVQALISSSHNNYEETEENLKRALVLHELSESKDGKARDLALLEDVRCRQVNQRTTTGHGDDESRQGTGDLGPLACI